MKRTFLCACLISALGVALAFAGGGQSNATANAGGPTRITGFAGFDTGQNYPDGFSHKDNWFMDWIEQKANIEWADLNVPVYADAQTKFNLMIASGTIPDFVEIFSRRGDMRRYADEGAFLDLTDYILNSPIMRERYTDLQLDLMRSDKDNRIYVLETLPINDDYNALFLRTDLLEKAGVTRMPETLDDYLNAMRAVKKYNPNALPYVSRALGMGSQFMFYPFNTNVNGWGYYPERGVYANNWEGDNIYKAAEFAVKLYSEGLLDPEFMTTDGASANQKRLRDDVLIMPQNRGGMSGRLNAFTVDGQDGARIIPVVMPVAEGVGIKAYHTMKQPLGGYQMAISAKTQNAAAVWRFIETLYSAEVKEMGTYGREGVDYNTVNGNKVPIFPSAIDNTWREAYLAAWTCNVPELMDYLIIQAIYGNQRRTAAQNADYAARFQEGAKKAADSALNHEGFYPWAFLPRTPDDISNMEGEAAVEQQSLFARLIVGEITMAAFRTQKEAHVAKYQRVTDWYNEQLKIAKSKYNLNQ